MPSLVAPPQPIPPPAEPVIDPKTGLMTLVWYQYFVAQDLVARDSQRRLTAGGL